MAGAVNNKVKVTVSNSRDAHTPFNASTQQAGITGTRAWASERDRLRPSLIGPHALPSALEKVTTTGGRSSANKHSRQQLYQQKRRTTSDPGTGATTRETMSRPPWRYVTTGECARGRGLKPQVATHCSLTIAFADISLLRPHDCPVITATRLLPCGTLRARNSRLPLDRFHSVRRPQGPSGPSTNQNDVTTRR